MLSPTVTLGLTSAQVSSSNDHGDHEFDSFHATKGFLSDNF